MAGAASAQSVTWPEASLPALVPTGCRAVPGFRTDMLEEGQHTGALRVVEGAPESDCHQDQCPWVSGRRPSALLGDLPTLARRSGSASCQISAFTLGPRACESVCPPVTSGMCFHSSFGTPEVRPRWPSKPNAWGAVFLVPDSWAGGPGVWACDSHARGGASIMHLFSRLCVAHPD